MHGGCIVNQGTAGMLVAYCAVVYDVLRLVIFVVFLRRHSALGVLLLSGLGHLLSVASVFFLWLAVPVFHALLSRRNDVSSTKVALQSQASFRNDALEKVCARERCSGLDVHLQACLARGPGWSETGLWRGHS